MSKWEAAALIGGWGAVLAIFGWLWFMTRVPKVDEYTGNEAGSVKHEAPKD